MFEEQLFEKIKNSFAVSGINLEFGYGEIISTAQAPYIVQYSLDMDGTRQMLCNEDDFTDGNVLVQWNIYALNASNADYICQELFKFIIKMNNAGDYKITLAKYQSNRNLNNGDTGLAMAVLSMNISYTKKEKENLNG